LSGETQEHRSLKEKIGKKLEVWFGASITEYASSGHELDVFSISPKGIRLMVEIIWTPSSSNFFRDLNILLQSDAQIKVVVVNEAILSKSELVREFQKAKISEIKKGYTMSNMINGNKILEDENYLNSEVYGHLKELLNESGISLELEIEELGKKLLSGGTKLSPIIAECINLSKKMDVKKEYLIWLKNELYGYEDYLDNASSKISEPSDLPNNPDYRKIPGEIRLSYTNSDTGKLEFERIDKPVVLTQPVAELEDLMENMRGAREFSFAFPSSYFPKIKGLNFDRIPVVFKTTSLTSCLQGLTLRLHRYLEEVLLSNIKQ